MTTDAAIEAFELRYAAESNTTIEALHAHGRFGVLCDCGERDCAGVKMGHFLDRLRDAGWTPPAVDRNIVSVENTERNRTGNPGGYTYHAPVAPSTSGAVIVVACVRLGDHAHVDIDSGVAVPTPFGDHDPELRRGQAGHLTLAWPDWILLRSILAASPAVHIAEVENPTVGQLDFHTRSQREEQIARLLVMHPDMEVWFR